MAWVKEQGNESCIALNEKCPSLSHVFDNVVQLVLLFGENTELEGCQGLQEVHHWKWALSISSLAPLPVSYLLPE